MEFLQVANSETDRLTRLVNDILDLSKLETEKALKLEEVEELYKNKVITDEERKKMRNKILGID